MAQRIRFGAFDFDLETHEVRRGGAHDLPLIAYTAFGQERAELAEFLLSAGADGRERAFGFTALHLAATKGYLALAEVLLAHGADVNATAMSKGQEVTPLAMAVTAKQEKMGDFLRAKGGRS